MYLSVLNNICESVSYTHLVISFCVNNSIAVDWIRISWSNKVYFFDNYISSNCFICNISAKIAKVICE